MSTLGQAAMSRLARFSEVPGQGDTSEAYGEVLPVRLVPTDDIDPHPDNREIDRDHVARLADDIAEIGLGQYVLLRPSPDGGGRWQCIVGHHRIEAYKLLDSREPGGKWASIPAVICDFDDDRTLKMLVDSNLHSRPLSREELGREMLKLRPVADRMREEDPERYRGARTAEIMRDIYNDGAEEGAEISTRTVERGIAAARRAETAGGAKPPRQEIHEAPGAKEARAASRAASSLAGKLEKLAELAGQGVLPDATTWASICGNMARASSLADALRAKVAAAGEEGGGES